MRVGFVQNPLQGLAHVLLVQVVVQVVLQPPQLLSSSVVLISQPLLASLSQLAKPVLHEIPQLPPEQLAVPLVLLHAFLQAPQLERSVVTSASQPVPTFASQSRNVEVQAAIEQTEFWQLPVAFFGAQGLPQPPQ